MRIISSIREQPKLIPLGRDAVKDLNGIVSAGFSFTIHRNKGMCCSVPVIKFMIVLLFEMPMWICQAYFMRRMRMAQPQLWDHTSWDLAMQTEFSYQSSIILVYRLVHLW